MTDGTSILDKLFPDTPPHAKQTRASSTPGNPAYLTMHEGRSASKEVNGRWASVCTLELRGLSQKNIAEALGIAPHTVSVIVNDDRYIQYRRERLAALDEDFVAMKPLALSALRGGLQSADENTALRASEQWFRAASFGGYSKTEQPSRAVTAEDVAKQLLQVNVQVNVDASSKNE